MAAPRTRQRQEPRTRIIRAAARLLRDGGIAAVTTRGVAEAAAVQPPAIYRLFGDKDGLIEAVVEYEAERYVEEKSRDGKTSDPLADLRSSWDRNVRFGLENPALFVLLVDPSRVARSPVSATGLAHLRALVGGVAAAGRLRVGADRAVALLQAAGVGAVMTLLAMDPGDRDPGLPGAMFDSVMREILRDADPAEEDPSIAAAVTLRAGLPRLGTLTAGERALMAELLERVAESPTPAD